MQQVSSFVSLVKRGLLPFRICWSKRRQLTMRRPFRHPDWLCVMCSPHYYSQLVELCLTADQPKKKSNTPFDCCRETWTWQRFPSMVDCLKGWCTHCFIWHHILSRPPQAQVSVPSFSIVWRPDARVGAKVQEVVLRNRLAFEIVSRSSREYDQVLAFRWQTSPRGMPLEYLQYWGTICGR